ncbi:MAG: hypothetical protein WCK20_06275 [Thermoleophilia bacterium]
MSSRVIARRYTLEVPEAPAPGRMVWRGRDAVSGGAVVVTLLDEHPQVDATLAALVAVRHPSLPVILDHGIDGVTRYLVTPARAGQTARLRLADRGQLTGADAAALGAAIADALATLHERGLVQGTVSLDALVLDETGPPRLEDLATGGLARPADQPDDDVRALAAILREVLTIPDDANLLEFPGLTPRFAGLLQSMASINPPAAASARDALRRIGDGQQPLAGATGWEPFVPVETPVREQSERSNRGLKVLVGVLAVGVVVLAVVAAVAVVDRRDANQSAVITGLPGPVTTVINTDTVEGGTTTEQQTTATVPTGASHVPRPIRIVGITPLDPAGDRQENNQDAHFAIDRSLSTGWSTEIYKKSTLGNKGGVGLALRLVMPSRVTQLVLRTAPVGATIALYAVRGTEPTTAPRGWITLTEPVTLHRSRAVLRIRHRAPVTTVLVWISGLPAERGAYVLRINDIRVVGVPSGA